MVYCSVCGKEVYDYKTIYAKELIGVQLPRLYICGNCENKKEAIDKLKKETFINDYKDKRTNVNKMLYKVIWDNGTNSSTYTSLEAALLEIKFLVEGSGYYSKRTEVKLEVIEDKSE